MIYDPKKWADLKAQVEWNEKYGENANVIKSTNAVEAPKTKAKHSFPELLHVHYEVIRHNLKQFPEDSRGNPSYNPYALPYDKEGQYHKV